MNGFGRGISRESARADTRERSSPPNASNCSICCSDIPTGAKKCPFCHEWHGETTLTQVDLALRACGFGWLVLSVIGAFYVSGALGEGALLARSWIIALLLQGVVVGLALVSFAERGPRPPL
jgi:hypothetical protein